MAGKKRAMAIDASASGSGNAASKTPRKEFPEATKTTRIRENDWRVARIVIGDDTIDASGIRLQAGILFASASMHGGNESFHPISEESFQVSPGWIRAEAMSWAISSVGRRKLSDNQKRPSLAFPAAVKQSASMRSEFASNGLLSYCKAFPGVAVIIGGPGARGASTISASSFVASAEAVFCSSEGDFCVQASLVNAIASIRGLECARAAKPVIFGCLAPITRLADCRKKLDKTTDVSCELRKMKGDIRAKYIVDKFRWIANEATGLWIVRLGQAKVVDYCVLVDGDRKLIIDSQERYPIVLREDTLRASGGDEASSLRIIELRQFCSLHRKT